MVEMVTKLPVRTETKSAGAPAYWRNRPWYPLEPLRRSLDRLFSEFDAGFLPTPFRRTWVPDETGDAALLASPAVDIVHKTDGFEIKAELPGVDEKDIEVKIVDGGLMIRGDKKTEKHEKQTDYVMTERSFGRFERFFALPEGVELDKIAASFSKGVLTVTLPKALEARQQERKITIKAA